jgi:hypothetical protein
MTDISEHDSEQEGECDYGEQGRIYLAVPRRTVSAN